MSPPDDTPPLARLARWSEWWFTPRWRALLTWVALTAITEAVCSANPWRFFDLIQQPITYLNRLLPAPLPRVFGQLADISTAALLFTWFEPLALRLSLRRGLAWIGLILAAANVVTIVKYLSPWLLGDLAACATFFGATALQCVVLRGWRSAPWMCLLARVLTVALSIRGPKAPHVHYPGWLMAVVAVLPSAALLLYGTRLLHPEEHARGTPAK